MNLRAFTPDELRELLAAAKTAVVRKVRGQSPSSVSIAGQSVSFDQMSAADIEKLIDEITAELAVVAPELLRDQYAPRRLQVRVTNV